MFALQHFLENLQLGSIANPSRTRIGGIFQDVSLIKHFCRVLEEDSLSFKSWNTEIFERAIFFDLNINAKCFEFLSRGEIDDMFVDASLALKQFLVKQVESHTRSGLGVYRHSKLIGMPGRDADMTCSFSLRHCILIGFPGF